MSDILSALEAVVGNGRIKQGESLALHTVAKKGGNAEFYTEIEKTDELIRIVQEARKLGLPVSILGSGAYVKIADGNIAGLVIKNNCRRFEKASMKGTIRAGTMGVEDVLFFAEAGVITNQLVRYTIEEGFEGLEYQLGLPGTIGGAIATNAKYKPKNIPVRSHLYSIRILGKDGEVQSYTKELPHFVSLDRELVPTDDIILSVAFKLMPGDKKVLWERGEEAVAFRNENYKFKITNSK